MKCLHKFAQYTCVWLYLNVSEFYYRSVPIRRYFQHLIKPLFLNTWGRFISHVIAFTLALDLSYFVRNY